MSNENVRRPVFAGGSTDKDALQKTMQALFSETLHRNERGAGVRQVRAEANVPKVASTRKQSERAIPSGVVQDMLFERPARRRLNSMVLSPLIRENIDDFLVEYSHLALLREHALEPRHTVLLIGPPGTGKTSLAEAIATEAGVPFLTVRYDGLVDSYLGETATRLRRVMEFAASAPCVLFFDEFDALGKERSDKQETGEIKRVVSSLLVQVDALPSSCIVICATNHPELLDRAVWRRFELRLTIPLPGETELREWFRRFEKSVRENLNPYVDQFLDCMRGQSFSEVESFGLDLRRKTVISGGSLKVHDIIGRFLKQWAVRSQMNIESGINHDGPTDNPPPKRSSKRPAV